MKIFLLAFATLVSTLNTFATEAALSLTGTVVDSVTNEAIPLATISLKNYGNEKIVAAVIADNNGKFLITNIKPGKYDLSIYFMGYAPKTITVDLEAATDMGKISVSPSSKTLGEATIVSEKSLIVKNSEKTVFNVAQSPNNQVGTAEDVLRNMPGVIVDQKDNISITGKQGVKILVDGKPNAMAQNDLPDFLKSIPANSIESIELITNPSAKYDAEGNAGIINIILKKGKANGLNGSLSASYGILNRYNFNAAINYRKNKINFFADYALTVNKIPNHWIENRTITVRDTTTYYNFESKGTPTLISNNLKAGFDYFIDTKNSITYTAGANYSHFNWLSNAIATNSDSSHEETASYNSTDNEVFQNFSITNDISYTHKFDSAGRELDIDVSHTYVSGNNNATLNSLGYDSTGAYNPQLSLVQPTHSLTTIHNFVFQLDYSHPLKRLTGYKIDLGVKNETTNNQNVFKAYHEINNVEVPDTLLSNKFNYTENIAALYFIMSGGYKKLLTYSAGLRGEHTYITSNNSSVDKNYFSLFPSGTLTGNIDQQQTLSLSYSRRVQRPQFRQINNTISYVDQYTTWQGNAFLQPSFSNIVSANYTIMVKQHMFSFDASGNFATNGFIESSVVDSNRITRGGVTNGTTSNIFNFTFFSKLQITKWWDLQMNHTYAYSYFGFKAGLNTAPLSGSSYNLWANTNFKFWKNMEITIGGWFNSKGVQAQGVIEPIGGLHASIKKSFFKDKLTVAIAGQDLLNTVIWRWTVSNSSLIDQGSWQSYDRTVMLILTWRFGSNQNVPERKAKEGDDRLGGGGKSR
jgi:iron complex outermembrane receptor protein